jgi:hypothetical protein
MDKTDLCVTEYESTPNLKLIADRLGIPWQTVYWHLRKAGVPVVGNKKLYGSDKDKMAAIAEEFVKSLLPDATYCNLNKFQSQVDFEYKEFKIEVKSSTLGKSGKGKSERWAFGFKKTQQEVCDFAVLLAYGGETTQDFGNIQFIFLIPKEFLEDKSTVSIPKSLKSKWKDFIISEKDIKEFFKLI